MDEDTYHYDFTTASELEIFIARLEEIFHEWGLHRKPLEESLKKNDFTTKEWCTSSENLTFSEAEFMLVRYYLKCDAVDDKDVDESPDEDDTPAQAVTDMMSLENDFFSITNPPSESSHPLARWYGLRDFLVLIPQHSSNVASESRIKVLLSSLSIAAGNVNCKVPLFLQAMEPWQCYFLGIHQSGTYRTEFNMVHLKRTPPHCKFLTGLLTMFKSKIGAGMPLNPVMVSVQFTYVLKNWSASTWTQEPPDMNFLGGDVLFVSEIGSLPFGSTYDSINELSLSAIWPSVLENSIADSENYTDLDPLQAPIWRVSVSKVDNLSCLLTDYFTEFLSLTEEKHTIKDLLGNLIGSKSGYSAGDSEVTSSLNALTESKISAFSKAVIGAEKVTKKEGSRYSYQPDQPISSENLMTLLYYLFPDADETGKTPYPENLGGTASTNAMDDRKLNDLHKKLSGMKSAPFDGLVWRLSIAMAHVIHSLGGTASAAYWWYEFTQELRYRWENGITIPGLEIAHPDSKTCLLNQKLQLLNCCISRKVQRDKQASEKPAAAESDSEGDDEFFDCDAEVDEDEDSQRKPRTAASDKPIGRLTKHGDLKLLKTGEAMYVPVTQDSVPKTDDQLEEDTQVLLKLGTDALGSELRAKLLSAYLLSDMEAFKAANPGCVLADFIRWCSPRDWIEEESGELDEFGQKKGHLSNRMEIPGNTWAEVWEVARPVPAKWQKRLFNDTKEAEKVLDYLERKAPHEFIPLLLPVMTVCIIDKLLEEDTGELPVVSEIIARIVKKVERLGRMPKVTADSYKELINDISSAETRLVHLKSLKQKFAQDNEETSQDEMDFIRTLVTSNEAEVPDGPKSKIGGKIRQYFAESAKNEQLLPEPGSQLTSERWNVMSPFSSPNEKEMILRLTTANGPQRLHAILKKNECRICGAFTKNIYFPH